MSILSLVIGEWVVLGAWWAHLAIERWRDRRLLRRLNAQPWWPPMATTPPATTSTTTTMLGWERLDLDGPADERKGRRWSADE